MCERPSVNVIQLLQIYKKNNLLWQRVWTDIHGRDSAYEMTNKHTNMLNLTHKNANKNNDMIILSPQKCV